MSNNARRVGFLAGAGQASRDLEREHFISTALNLAGNVIGYDVSERLAALYPDRAVVESDSGAFDLEDYAAAGYCTLTPKPTPHPELMLSWYGPEEGLKERVQNAWLEVVWQGHELEVVVMQFNDDKRYYVLASTKDVAMCFLRTVCSWNIEVHDEVLVFEHGRWDKDERLFAAIKGARFDNLVLRGALKSDILADVTRFFASQGTYETYGVPWKRGVLFAGPPGNGKTHAVKALVNALGKPCLYVKSFKERGEPDEYGMHAVFERARAAGPCILVLEDLDALVTDANRSFFLNEMDGFAANGGILTLATTNHPERLDPAIVHRPSRFDRTYRFDLPAYAERHAYIGRWNASLQPEMRLSGATVTRLAEATDDFSFAYLKELFLSAMMSWLEEARPDAMDGVIEAQAGVLRAQVRTTTPETPAFADGK